MTDTKSQQMVTAALKLKDTYSFHGRKATTNLDSILKSRYITLPRKVRLIKVMLFAVVVYGYRAGPLRRLSAKELMLLNCGVGEDS